MSNSFEKNSSVLPLHRPNNLSHPDDVIRDEMLPPDEKRAILASWASDSHAVEDAPTLRQLDNGAVVDLDVILRALRSLDDGRNAIAADAIRPTPDSRWWRGLKRHDAILTRWRKKTTHARRSDHDDHDDHDPPPCPASNAMPSLPIFVPAFGRLAA